MIEQVGSTRRSVYRPEFEIWFTKWTMVNCKWQCHIVVK